MFINFSTGILLPEVFSADIANDNNAEQTNQLPIKHPILIVSSEIHLGKVKLQEKEFFAAG